MSDTSAATIQVNGQPLALSAKHLADLLHERGVNSAGKGIAVALNGAVVSRAAWGETRLLAGDTVEIVLARQGG
jgi:sulfur carrier protein